MFRGEEDRFTEKNQILLYYKMLLWAVFKLYWGITEAAPETGASCN